MDEHQQLRPEIFRLGAIDEETAKLNATSETGLLDSKSKPEGIMDEHCSR